MSEGGILALSRLIDTKAGLSGSTLTGPLYQNSTNTLTALAGGGVPTAIQTGSVLRVTTCGATGGLLKPDSVWLPAATTGSIVTVINSGANPLAVFPYNSGRTDDINNQSAVVVSTAVATNTITVILAASGTAFLSNLQTVYLAGLTLRPGTNGTPITAISITNSTTFTGTTSGISDYTTSADAAGIVYTPAIQPSGAAVIYSCAGGGKWFSEGTGLGSSGSFATLSCQNLVLAAGTTQATATPLVANINRVTTSTSSANGVLLPPSAAGMSILVINADSSGIDSIVVWPSSTDTINDGTASVGVTQFVKSAVLYVCAVAGSWNSVGLGAGYAASSSIGTFPTTSFNNAFTASATTQTSAIAISSTLTRISVCGANSAGSQFSLPVLSNLAGVQCTVFNQATSNLTVLATNLTTPAIQLIPYGSVTPASSSMFVTGATVTFSSCNSSGPWMVSNNMTS